MLEDTSPQYRNRDLEPLETNRPDEESGSQIRETIEDATKRVRDKVGDATHEVRDQVKGAASHVREQVEDAVDEVRGFDLRQQVAAHPWMAVSIAAVAGYVFGSMGGDADSEHAKNKSSDRRGATDHRSSQTEYRPSHEDLPATNAYRWAASAPYGANPSSFGFVGQSPEVRSDQSTAAYQPMPQSYQSPTYAAAATAQQDQHSQRTASPQRSQMWDTVRDQFGSELRTMVTAAVGTAIGLVRDTVTETVPQFAEEYERRTHERKSEQESETKLGHTYPSSGQTATTPDSNQSRSGPTGATPTSWSSSDQPTPPSGGQSRSGLTGETPTPDSRKREPGA